MPAEANKATVRRFWDEFNRGNLAVIDECFAEDFVRYTYDGKTMDRAGYKGMCAVILKAMPDCKVIVDDMVGEGDKVAFRMTLAGTDTGGWGNDSPTGKTRTIKETYFAKFKSGKIVEFVNLAKEVLKA